MYVDRTIKAADAFYQCNKNCINITMINPGTTGALYSYHDGPLSLLTLCLCATTVMISKLLVLAVFCLCCNYIRLFIF